MLDAIGCFSLLALLSLGLLRLELLNGVYIVAEFSLFEITFKIEFSSSLLLQLLMFLYEIKNKNNNTRL